MRMRCLEVGEVIHTHKSVIFLEPILDVFQSFDSCVWLLFYGIRLSRVVVLLYHWLFEFYRYGKFT